MIVARDGRDVFMSMLNHHSNYTPQMLKVIKNFDAVAGGPFPFELGEPRSWFRNWATRGTFEWEQDGYPSCSHFYHFQSWWNYRHLPNIYFVHFANLLDVLGGSVDLRARVMPAEACRYKSSEKVCRGHH